MITEKKALALLKKHLRDEDRIAHSIGVAEIAHDLARRIHVKHPGLPVDPSKVKIAALLHDIGRSRKGDHEINSIEILKEEGLHDIAAITMHGSLYEIMRQRGTSDPSLLPQTLENKIVAYADTRYRDRPVTMEERWAEIEKRRAPEKEKIDSLRAAKARYRALEQELLDLVR